MYIFGYRLDMCCTCCTGRGAVLPSTNLADIINFVDLYITANYGIFVPSTSGHCVSMVIDKLVT